MNEEDIQGILDRLGGRVGHLSEENRLCKIRDDAGKELIEQLGDYLSPEDWVSLFESTEQGVFTQVQNSIVSVPEG
mgnify:CR=1 FL=1